MPIVLATSASKPEYKRDFLTCVASPIGREVSFSYHKKWIDEDLLEQELQGQEAVIVFCNPSLRHGPDEFDFFAFRRVTIMQLVPPTITNLRDGSTVVVQFKLGALVLVTDLEIQRLFDQWNDALRAVAHRPRGPDHRDVDTARFVFDHPPLGESTRPKQPDEQESWRAISERLAGFSTLKDGFFFRVDGVRKLTKKATSPEPLTTEPGGSFGRVYPLRTNTEYEVALDAYSSSGKNPYTQAIKVTSSSAKLEVQAVTQSSAGRASQAVLVLRAGGVQRPQFATLIIEGAEGFEHEVPRVELPTHIKPDLAWVALLVVIIAVGVVLGGLPADAFDLSDSKLYTLKAIGGLIVGIATFVALGRAPGVGK